MARSRVVIVIVGCLAAGLYLEGHRPVRSTPPADASTADVSTKAPTPVGSSESVSEPPPPTETPYRVVLAALPREAFPDVEQHGSTVRVRYRLGSIWSTAMGRRNFDTAVAEIVPDLFARFPTISTIIITVEASTVDIRGDKGRASAAEVEFSRRNAQSIHWGAIDTGNIERLADRAWYDHRFE